MSQPLLPAIATHIRINHVPLFNPRAIASGSLNLIWRLGRQSTAAPDSDPEQTLRSLLRRFPYWSYGHRELALLALKRDNVGLAYSSAVVYEALCRKAPKSRREGLLIIGQCFLKRGDSLRALSYFEHARSLGLDTPQLAEEIAAAYILRGKYVEALESLSQIQPELLSAEAKAALTFVRSKQ